MTAVWLNSLTDHVREQMGYASHLSEQFEIGRSSPRAAFTGIVDCMARSMTHLANAIDAITVDEQSPARSSAGGHRDPCCPSCHRALDLATKRVTAVGTSYDIDAAYCRHCGNTISVFWHTSVLIRFAQYVTMQLLGKGSRAS